MAGAVKFGKRVFLGLIYRIGDAMDEVKLQFVNKLKPFQKLLLSILMGAIAYFTLPMGAFQGLHRLIFGWDICCIFLLVLTWITFYTTHPKQIRKEAQLQDPKSIIIFFVVLIASSVSLLGVIMLITGQSGDQEPFGLTVTLACMFLSWALVHTIFATRYAHLYYADHATERNRTAGGLDFPEEDKPDFVDFAYFSFTLGMTFQVSDVEISARKIRRLVLWHCLLSFVYNATIIALTVNIIASLSK